MNKKLLQFLNGEINYIETMCSIGREPLPDREFVMISPVELKSSEPLYKFWNPKKPQNSEEPEIKKSASKGRRKTYYVKVSLKELKELTKDKLSYEYMGMFLHLTAFIEWESGLLIRGRGKHRRKMTRADIAKVLNISDSTAWRLVSKLTELGLIIPVNNGFRIASPLFSKGRNISCE